MANTFDSEKQRFESRIELSARKELSERKLCDMKTENKEVTMDSEVLNKKIDELVLANANTSNKASSLNAKVDDLQQKKHDLERMNSDNIARVNSPKQERREYTRKMEDRIKQKDMLLAETFGSFKTGPKARVEPWSCTSMAIIATTPTCLVATKDSQVNVTIYDPKSSSCSESELSFRK
mmetsp:Transcript_10224/g.22730  ORF Transcript_10224/g.22730 Transcript_10224/m.22730 type:complete len:180 (-) Transcript_10224:1140-1679(-)